MRTLSHRSTREERRGGSPTRLRSSPAGQGGSAPRPGCCSARRARASCWSTATPTPMSAALAQIRAAVPAAQVDGVAVDVGREEAADQAVAAARKAFGAVEVLVNLAGIRSYEPLARGQARNLGAHARGQSVELCGLHPRRDRRPARLRPRQHRQHLVDPRGQCARRHGAIRRDQGRHRVADANACIRGGEARHPRQRGLPGRDAHAVPPAPRRGRGAHAARSRRRRRRATA